MIIFLTEQYSSDLSQKSVLRNDFRILLVKVLQLEKDKGDKVNNLRQKQINRKWWFKLSYYYC